MGSPSSYVLHHISEGHKETWKAHCRELKEHVEGLTLLLLRELQHPTSPCEKVNMIAVKDGWVCGWHGCIVVGVSKD
jgi:hypothetical protein